METWTLAEVNSVVWFLLATLAPINEIHRQWKEIYADGVVRVQLVSKWCRDF
jgi:hypothetical protein